VGIFGEAAKSELYTDDFYGKIASDAPLDLIGSLLKDRGDLSLLDRLLLTDIGTNLPGDLLVKMDIASMTNSLETRSPFLDQGLMEFAARLPDRYKIRRMTKKYILKKAAEGLIPRQNIHRRKMGFGVPVGKWFRGEMRGFLTGTLLSDASLKRGYFNPAKIRELVEKHTSGQKDYSFQLWALLMLELWHLKFLDERVCP
jgi:asparagine synthase (glutamine-hydrolysing)